MSFKLSCTEWFFLTITKQKRNICPVILAFVNPSKGLFLFGVQDSTFKFKLWVLNWNSQSLPAWTGLNSSTWSLHSVKCGCITFQTHASGNGSWNISYSYKQTWGILRLLSLIFLQLYISLCFTRSSLLLNSLTISKSLGLI